MSGLVYKFAVAPPIWLVRTVVITPASRILYFITLPARALLASIVSVLSFFVDLIRAYESFLIFVGTAIFIGAVVGGTLHLLSRTLATIIGAGDASTDSTDEAASRTIADYRKARQRRKLESETEASINASMWTLNPSDEQGFGHSTILEEEDSDF